MLDNFVDGMARCEYFQFEDVLSLEHVNQVIKRYRYVTFLREGTCMGEAEKLSNERYSCIKVSMIKNLRRLKSQLGRDSARLTLSYLHDTASMRINHLRGRARAALSTYVLEHVMACICSALCGSDQILSLVS